MCIYFIDIKYCRLVTWFKQSLMSRREMNIFKSWWCCRIRLSVWLRSHVISFISLMLFTCTNSRPTHSFVEMDGNYWEGTSKCWFSEGSRCDPKCSKYITGIIFIVILFILLYISWNSTLHAWKAFEVEINLFFLVLSSHLKISSLINLLFDLLFPNLEFPTQVFVLCWWVNYFFVSYILFIPLLVNDHNWKFCILYSSCVHYWQLNINFFGLFPADGNGPSWIAY